MSSAFFYERRNPEWYANDIRRELVIGDDKAVNLDYITNALDIRVKYAEINKGILGASKVKGLKKLIVISPDISYNTRKRFTVAHEIGHLLIHHGVHFCRADDLKMWVSTKAKEKEANQFAVQLLLPRIVVANELKKRDISLDFAQELSNQYEISLSSAALRMVEVSAETVAVFCQKDTTIQWGMPSPECRLRLRSGVISNNALSYLVGIDRPKQDGYVNPNAWFEDGSLLEDYRCYEQTWYFPKINMKLSVVRLEDDEY